MMTSMSIPHTSHDGQHDGHSHDHAHHDTSGTTLFGFWLYLMTDCVLFASVFATYAVVFMVTTSHSRVADCFC